METNLFCNCSLSTSKALNLAFKKWSQVITVSNFFLNISLKWVDFIYSLYTMLLELLSIETSSSGDTSVFSKVTSTSLQSYGPISIYGFLINGSNVVTMYFLVISSYVDKILDWAMALGATRQIMPPYFLLSFFLLQNLQRMNDVYPGVLLTNFLRVVITKCFGNSF